MIQIITVSDTSKTQVHAYLTSNVLPSIPTPLRSKLESEEVFEKLYEAFGGRLAHWDDFVSDWRECQYLPTLPGLLPLVYVLGCMKLMKILLIVNAGGNLPGRSFIRF